MKKWVAVFAALVLAFVLPAPASAEETTQPGVTVGDFGQYLVQKGKKATVKPEVAKQGTVTVKSATMTVKHGKKTVARNVKSAKLRAGSYQVTTTIRWTATGSETVQTTVATKPLKIATFSASKQANALLAYINAARLNDPEVRAFITRNSTEYGVTASDLTLHRSKQLDKIATSWSKKSAKKRSYAKPDWKKVPDSFEWAWYLPAATVNPYFPTFTGELGSGYTGAGSPLLGCGVREDDNGDVTSACSDDIAALWGNVGFGFSWDKKGGLWVTVLLTSAKQ